MDVEKQQLIPGFYNRAERKVKPNWYSLTQSWADETYHRRLLRAVHQPAKRSFLLYFEDYQVLELSDGKVTLHLDANVLPEHERLPMAEIRHTEMTFGETLTTRPAPEGYTIDLFFKDETQLNRVLIHMAPHEPRSNESRSDSGSSLIPFALGVTIGAAID